MALRGYSEKICHSNDFSKKEAGGTIRNIGLQGDGVARNKNGTYAKINYLIVPKRHKISTE